MTNDPIDAHVEKMESVVMDVRADKQEPQMRVELKPQKAETMKSLNYTKVVLSALCLSLCVNVGSLAAFLASKETCVTGVALLEEGQEVPLKTKLTGLDLSDADSLEKIGAKAFRNTRITDTIETPFNVPTYKADSFPKGISIVSTISPSPSSPPPSPSPPLVTIPGLKECAVAPSGTGPCWELADPTMTAIPTDFLKGNTDLTGTLKLGAAVKTIGDTAFFETKLTSLDLSDAASLVSIGTNAFYNADITGTLVIPSNVETIGWGAFLNTKLTGLDPSQAASLVSIGAEAFGGTDITGTLVIPANVETIGGGAFSQTKLTGLDLSQAASLVSIGHDAFYGTDITGTIVMPPNVDIGPRNAFPSGVTIVTG